jgi:hypothetical protein
MEVGGRIVWLDCSIPAWQTWAKEFGPCRQSSSLSSLSLPLSFPRLAELMQLIPVPSVTCTAAEYMFLTV